MHSVGLLYETSSRSDKRRLEKKSAEKHVAIKRGTKIAQKKKRTTTSRRGYGAETGRKKAGWPRKAFIPEKKRERAMTVTRQGFFFSVQNKEKIYLICDLIQR